jgi:hypothetical protein
MDGPLFPVHKWWFCLAYYRVMVFMEGMQSLFTFNTGKRGLNGEHTGKAL